MATKIINTVEQNTAPPLVLTAKRSNVVINLSGCTVTLVITKGNTITNIGHQVCTITDSANGIVSYVRQAVDTPTSGKYKCDLVVTYGDSTVETLYDILVLNARKKSGSLV
jgi:hypothetical protein